MALITGDDRTVMVVDDSDDIRELISTQLRRMGYRVVEAANGEEAVELVPRTHPGLILMDLTMPGMDGYEVCRRLKLEPDPPAVLVVSALDGAEDEVAARRAGADGYVRKPFSPPDLLALIERI